MPTKLNSLAVVERAACLTRLGEHFYAIAVEHGFHDHDGDPHRLATYVSNIHGEVSELWEAYRRGALNRQCDKAVALTCAEEALADIVIRALDFANALGIDIGRAVTVKSAYNETRPPMHGKIAR